MARTRRVVDPIEEGTNCAGTPGFNTDVIVQSPHTWSFRGFNSPTTEGDDDSRCLHPPAVQVPGSNLATTSRGRGFFVTPPQKKKLVLAGLFPSKNPTKGIPYL